MALNDSKIPHPWAVRVAISGFNYFAFVPNKLEAMEFKVLCGCQDFLTCQQVDNLRGGPVVGGAS